MFRSPISGITSRVVLIVLVSVTPILLYLTALGEISAGLLLVTSIGIVVCLAGSVLVASRISRTLDRFSRAASRFAEGDLGARIYPPRIAELVEFSQSFNEMASQVQHRLEALRRLSTEQEAILRSMSEGVMTVDGEGKIGRINGAARVLLGLPVGSGEGRPFAELIGNPDLRQFVAESLSSSTPRSQVFSLTGPEERILEAYCSRLQQETLSPGMLLVLRDTTRVSRLENVRRDFVANVSHELRTPITSIKGFVETLMDGAMHEPESLRRFLEIIAKHADRLNAIFSDLLTLAQLESRGDNEGIGLEQCAASLVARAAVEACSLRAAERLAEIVVEVPDSLSVLANPTLLEQALVNLIDNAIKHSEARVSVRVCARLEGGSVVMAVSDTGPGIEKSHLSRLFERFYRIDQGRSRQMGGTGLGLAIVKHVAQAHGGRVDVESVVGQGSTFSLFLKPA